MASELASRSLAIAREVLLSSSGKEEDCGKSAIANAFLDSDCRLMLVRPPGGATAAA